jgi:hypothetical protein
VCCIHVLHSRAEFACFIHVLHSRATLQAEFPQGRRSHAHPLKQNLISILLHCPTSQLDFNTPGLHCPTSQHLPISSCLDLIAPPPNTAFYGLHCPRAASINPAPIQHSTEKTSSTLIACFLCPAPGPALLLEWWSGHGCPANDPHLPSTDPSSKNSIAPCTTSPPGRAWHHGMPMRTMRGPARAARAMVRLAARAAKIGVGLPELALRPSPPV